MKYKELVKIKKGFQTSIHLECDLNQIDKLESYIPTFQSTEVLGQFISSICYPTQGNMRAKVLVGPYGKGKSHLLLVLTALTSLRLTDTSEQAQELLTNLYEKISKVNEKTGFLIKHLFSQNIQLLPIIVDSNSGDIFQALLRALQEALLRANLSELLPTTHFDEVLNTIEKWKNEYPPAYESLKEMLKKHKLNLEDFIVSLKQYNGTSYELFTQIYPKITAGSQFYPFGNQNVVKVYSAMMDSLCENTAYNGVHIIFDEFSKFVEANMDTTKMNNFHVLQELAELSTRSKEKQIHFTCITHKNIVEYSQSSNFKAVDGRLLEIPFVSTVQDNYELIANALEKTDAFPTFYQNNCSSFRQLEEHTVPLFDGFSKVEYDRHVVQGCFPLSPICAFCLIGISELVGQNERTMFTFLAQQEKHALYPFFEKNRDPQDAPEFVPVDYLYDYFETLFKRELHHTPIHIIWSKTSQALLQCGKEDERRILKSMAIVKMLGDPRLKPTKAHLKATLMMSEEEFESGISLLLKKHILSLRDSQEYVLLTANGVDIKKSIEEYVSSKALKPDIVSLLSKYCPLGVVIPRKYNDDFCMFRYFPQVYMEYNLLFQYETPESFFADYPCDGIIIHVLAESPLTTEELSPIFQRFATHPQVVFCVSDKPFLLATHFKDLLAVEYLRKKNDGDTHYLEELDVVEEDIKHQIAHEVQVYFAPYSKESHFFSGGKELTVFKKSILSQKISEISEVCYPLTPVINNEMVNKNVLNSQNIKARNLVIDWMFSHSTQNVIPPIEGKGPEVSVFQSFYFATALHENVPTADAGLNAVLILIRNFLHESVGEWKSIPELYDSLIKPPYGIRKGVLPLLLAYCLREFYHITTLSFKGKEIHLSSELLSHINENPEGYTLRLDQNTPEGQNYLEKLHSLFIPDSPCGLSVYPVVKGMQQWLQSLPDYTKYYTKTISGEPLSQSFRNLRKELLKFELNPREFAWESVPQFLGTEGDYVKTIAKLSEFVETFSSHRTECQNHLILRSSALFGQENKESLKQGLISWFEELPSTPTEGKSRELCSFIHQLSDESQVDVLRNLIHIFVGTALEDWNDHCVSLYFQGLDQCLEDCKKQTQSNSETAFVEISPLGETLKSNLFEILGDYQDSIDPNEKRAILMSLLEEM